MKHIFFYVALISLVLCTITFAQVQQNPSAGGSTVGPQTFPLPGSISQPRNVHFVSPTVVPYKFSYQGLLLTNSGAPVTDGIYSLVFKIFGGLTGGCSALDRNAIFRTGSERDVQCCTWFGYTNYICAPDRFSLH